MSTNPSNHVYGVILNSTPQHVWQALTDPTQTQKYFFGSRIEVESGWKAGSDYRFTDTQGQLTSSGRILEAKAQSHLKMTFKPAWLPDAKPSTLSWELQALDSLTLLQLTHSDIDDATFEGAQMGVGWIFVLSSLKSLLETGKALPVPSVLAG
ncbi:MAG TPA: SRPBCC domain-containing protein [Ktedonobacteraceae bacterium]|nr:SRPBCC domain-containing protein [Ktedonobacteraceae bacterium]